MSHTMEDSPVERLFREILLVSIVVVTYQMHLLDAEYSTTQDWIQRPGTVYVCEGDTATFIWNSNCSWDENDTLYFMKFSPWHLLIKKYGYDEPLNTTNRVHLLVNSSYRFTLQNATLSDSGQYEIEVYHEQYRTLNHDIAGLTVLTSHACPSRRMYKHPVIYLSQTNSKPDIIEKGELLILCRPGIIEVSVLLPAAYPPVRCSASVGHDVDNYTCHGTVNKDSECTFFLSFLNATTKHVAVELTHIALEPSIMSFFIRREELVSPSTTSAVTPEAQVYSTASQMCMCSWGMIILSTLIVVNENTAHVRGERQRQAEIETARSDPHSPSR